MISSLLDSRIKYQEPCPLCQSPLEVSFFLTTNVRPMPLQVEDGYFIVSDELSIWPMSKNSEKYWVDIFLHRQDNQFQLQFRKWNEEKIISSTRKIEDLTDVYAKRVSALQAKKKCEVCRRYQFSSSGIYLNFDTMVAWSLSNTSSSYESCLYSQLLNPNEVKFYILQRVRQIIYLWAGKMEVVEFDEMRKKPMTTVRPAPVSAELELPDFPFEQMPEPDLLQRLDTLLLFS